MAKQVTFKGNAMNLQGNSVEAGQQAPNAELLNSGLEAVSIESLRGKNVLLNVVPSLDTPVCQIQSKQFFEKLSQNPNIELITVSMDLPFAQARFCGAENMDMQTLSDHRTASFGEAYGLILEPLRLLTRSVILLNAQGNIEYMEIVPEVTNEPNYDAAMQAIEKLTAASV